MGVLVFPTVRQAVREEQHERCQRCRHLTAILQFDENGRFFACAGGRVTRLVFSMLLAN